MGRIAVIGGTGFLGRRIVQALRQHGHEVIVGARHASGADQVQADVQRPGTLERACEGAAAVVNAVSLYRQTREARFHDIHVEGAAVLARAAERAGARRLVHISGIGADTGATDAYIRARGEGEAAVRTAFPAATILRPSAMFDRDGALFAGLAGLLRAPVVPLFGDGSVRLQPVFVEDVAEAAARMATGDGPALAELGGPHVYSYRQILERLAERRGLRRRFVPVPFAVWRAIAATAQVLPQPPLTPGMVALLERDNVASADVPGFAALGLSPRSAESLGLL